MELKLDMAVFSKSVSELVKKAEELAGDKVHEAGLEIVTTLTDKTLAESVKRAPIDEGMLQASHERTIEDGGTFGTIEGAVFIPANSPASDYALYMHEGHYKLGPASARKQATQKEIVGRKYLERALNDNINRFRVYILRRLRKVFES